MGLLLPPGSGEMPEELQRKLQYGDPATGWLGDENMYLARCDGKACGVSSCQGWTVNYAKPDGGVQRVMHSYAARMSAGFLRKLAEGDTRTVNITKVIEDVNAHNEKLHAEREQASAEAAAEAAERMEHAIRKGNI